MTVTLKVTVIFKYETNFPTFARIWTLHIKHPLSLPTTSNLIATLEPAFTAIWAYFLSNEILTGTQLMGGMLVLMGVILLRFVE